MQITPGGPQEEELKAQGPQQQPRISEEAPVNVSTVSHSIEYDDSSRIIECEVSDFVECEEPDS